MVAPLLYRRHDTVTVAAREVCAMFWLWGLAYFVADGLLVATLITLLCRGERGLPRAVEAFLPFKGRWLWYFLVTLNALCLLNLGWLFWMFARALT